MHIFFPTTFRKNNFLRNGTQAFKVLYFCDYFIQLYLLHAIVGDPSTGYVFDATGYVFDATGAFGIWLPTYSSSENYMYSLYKKGAKREVPC